MLTEEELHKIRIKWLLGIKKGKRASHYDLMRMTCQALFDKLKKKPYNTDTVKSNGGNDEK